MAIDNTGRGFKEGLFVAELLPQFTGAKDVRLMEGASRAEVEFDSCKGHGLRLSDTARYNCVVFGGFLY